MKKIILTLMPMLFMIKSVAFAAAQMPQKGDLSRLAATVKCCGSMNIWFFIGAVALIILIIISVLKYKGDGNEKRKEH